MRNDPDVQRVVSAYQLGLPPVPLSGRTGELLGRGTGTSLEFQEYREYQPGDDVRHLDWAAYARSDELMVRLYREEISPAMDILVDTTASMATSPPKRKLLLQLAATFALLSGQLGGRPKLRLVGDQHPPQSLGPQAVDLLEDVRFEAVTPLSAWLQSADLNLPRQSIRIVLSDFLFPCDPEVLVRRFAGGASALWFVQVLSRWEADPPVTGGRRLVDVETNEIAELVLDEPTVARYRRRLASLQQQLLAGCQRMHATFVTVVGEDGLWEVCRRALSEVGILRTA